MDYFADNWIEIAGLIIAAVGVWVTWYRKWMHFPSSSAKDDSGAHDLSSNKKEIRVGGDNSGTINAGDGTVFNVGDNATIVVGYTIEQHEASLKSREAQLRADADRVSAAENQVFQLQLTNVEKELADINASYEATVQENARLKSEIAAFAEYIPENEITRAQLALENGDRSTADAILKAAEGGSQNVVRDRARVAYLRGKIAEGEIRWQNALEHYKRAYDQDPTLQHQKAYAYLCWRMGRLEDALPLYKDIVVQVAAEHGKKGNEYAAALNDLAAIYQSTGRKPEAMPLFEEALSIRCDDLGADHPDTANSMNNLALLYRYQGRYSEAAPLWKEAVEIMERVLGAEHPNTKIMRGNYEKLLAKMKEKGR